jgi:phosphoglycerol transferase MdoB-like AlkP superfamily enzyme
MSIKFSRGRYSVLFSFIAFFLIASFLVRIVFVVISFSKVDIGLASIVRIFLQGLVFDFGVALFFSAGYAIYLLVLPQKWNRSWFNRIVTYIGTFLVLLIIMFSFFAEFSFWNEFESRFNFIAVDYLVYTFEVINNIAQSYPLPILVGAMLLLTAFVMWLFYRAGSFATSFNSHTLFGRRLLITGAIVAVSVLYALFIKNSWAEQNSNHYQNELAKAGIYSFFAAFKNNELEYDLFYPLIDRKEAFAITRKDLQEPGATFIKDGFSIRRKIAGNEVGAKPNVIMITIESFSADFMKYFGNANNLTPTLDSLAANSILFTNMYSTGTRTVRGMEALSLAIPPTPGNSIVRRPDNNDLLTVGSIFKSAGYDRSFFYGGDGYFDNMNKYFGDNGYDVTDKGRKLTRGEAFKAKRNTIPDSEVHFSNAWGICDEDLYDAVIKDADLKYANQKSFYDFVMTTSNHRPFTYPSGKIDIPSGTGREGAVKYTDFAIAQFLKKIKDKPWFKNTVLIFVADHCAASAGKNEIDISKYHIPCMIVNLDKVSHQKIENLCSQIDLYPTLFNLMGWSYESNLYGKNVLSENYSPRITLGTYQKLAYLKSDSLVILSPQQVVETYRYNKATNEQIPQKLPQSVINEAIAQYQTAYYLYKHDGLRK